MDSIPVLLIKFPPPDPGPPRTAGQGGGPRTQEKARQEETGNRRPLLPRRTVSCEDYLPSAWHQLRGISSALSSFWRPRQCLRVIRGAKVPTTGRRKVREERSHEEE